MREEAFDADERMASHEIKILWPKESAFTGGKKRWKKIPGIDKGSRRKRQGSLPDRQHLS